MSEPTYELIDDGRAIRCHFCGQTSHNPTDVAQRYCGQCKVFHEDVAELMAELRRLRIDNDTLRAIIQGAGEQLGQGEIPLTVAIAQLHIALKDAQRQNWRTEGLATAATIALSELEQGGQVQAHTRQLLQAAVEAFEAGKGAA